MEDKVVVLAMVVTDRGKVVRQPSAGVEHRRLQHLICGMWLRGTQSIPELAYAKAQDSVIYGQYMHNQLSKRIHGTWNVVHGHSEGLRSVAVTGKT